MKFVKVLALAWLALPLCFGATGISLTATIAGTGATAAASAKDSLDGSDRTFNYHTVQTVGSPATCTLRLEGSLDGTNWQDLSGTQTCTSALMFHVDGKPISFARINVLTFSGTMTVIYKGQN